MPPFNAQSLHQLAQKIIQGTYADPPPHFSKNISYLLNLMLKTDPNKRPSINQILKIDFIRDRVTNLLNEDDFKEEFSHTILHNQNVFDQFKAIQQDKKKQEEKKRLEEEEKQKQE